MKREKKKVSFDCWGTLLESNPEYKEKQSQKSYDMFGIQSDIFIKNIKESKKYFDLFVEEHGLHIPRELIYNRAFPELSLEDIKQFIIESNKLFREYPPFIKECLDMSLMYDLVRKNEVYVTSNTVMIYSDVLKYIIQDCFSINVPRMFFSDVEGYSKPHKLIFRPFLDYHIGDNHITDGACEEYGIKFLDINNNEDIQILSQFI